MLLQPTCLCFGGHILSSWNKKSRILYISTNINTVLCMHALQSPATVKFPREIYLHEHFVVIG